ncbi:MAG: type II toxin-antitoxin system RelE/ParE family toxin [Actinomycetota bacterium]
MRRRIDLSKRAQRDLRAMPPAGRESMAQALRGFATGASNLDLRPLHGREPWHRLRVGSHRIIYRPTPDGFLVYRVIDRSELERVVAGL